MKEMTFKDFRSLKRGAILFVKCKETNVLSKSNSIIQPVKKIHKNTESFVVFLDSKDYYTPYHDGKPTQSDIKIIYEDVVGWVLKHDFTWFLP